MSSFLQKDSNSSDFELKLLLRLSGDNRLSEAQTCLSAGRNKVDWEDCHVSLVAPE